MFQSCVTCEVIRSVAKIQIYVEVQGDRFFGKAKCLVVPLEARTCCGSGQMATGIETFSLFRFNLGWGLYQVVAQLALTL